MSWMKTGKGIPPRKYAQMLCEEPDIGRRRDIFRSVPPEMKQWVKHLALDAKQRQKNMNNALQGDAVERVARCDKKE